MAVLGSTIASHAVANPPDARRIPTLAVIGDSITSKYNDLPNSERQGFWSILGQRLKVRTRLSAEGNSGFLKRGNLDCSGTTFGERLTHGFKSMARKANALIVQGGRNDFHTCDKDGNLVRTRTPQLKAAVNKFFDDLEQLRDPGACTIVLTPWGPKGVQHRDRVIRVIRAATCAHGFTFVPTRGVLTEKNTNDGIHPNRSGNEALARVVQRRTRLGGCLTG